MNTSEDLTTGLPRIAADRLSLRQLVASDVPALFEIFSDPEVTRYWGFERFRTMREAELLFEQIEHGRTSASLFQWGITTLDSDTIIGTTTIYGWVRARPR